MWADIVFRRLPGVMRFRAHTIDLLGDVDGKVVIEAGCDTGRNCPWNLERARNAHQSPA